MFILAIVDDTPTRRDLREEVVAHGHQVDFAGSDEDLAELCRQTEPDALILCGHYEDVSAKYLLKHLKGESSGTLPECVLVIDKEPEPDYEVVPGILARWVPMGFIPSALQGTPYVPEAESVHHRILHITDDRLLQKIVADLIHKQTDYEIETASTGRTGLELYASFHPDVILTDWDLPDIDGIELCRRIKVELQDQHTQIALFSSMTDEHLIESAYQAHAKAYIVKPVKPELLLNRVRKLMEKGA